MWITEVSQLACHSLCNFKSFPNGKSGEVYVNQNAQPPPTISGISAGVLACLDGYMNIAIEQTEEYVNGQLKNKYGDAFLRGNNGKTRGKEVVILSRNTSVYVYIYIYAQLLYYVHSPIYIFTPLHK